MISLKDYAKSKKISYEAVRKQVARYKTELEGHISKIHRTQYLDDAAIKFLDEKRAINPVAIIQIDKDEEIERLKEENKSLLVNVATLQDSLLKSQSQIERLKEIESERLKLEIEADSLKEKNKSLETEKNELIVDNKVKIKEIEEKDKQLSTKEKELELTQSKMKELEERLEKANKAGFFKKLFTPKW